MWRASGWPARVHDNGVDVQMAGWVRVQQVNGSKCWERYRSGTNNGDSNLPQAS